MRHYRTHEFAHPETLDRAVRWLLQCGVEPSAIETHREGVPRLAVLTRPGEDALFRQLVSAVETADPEGWPSFWETARMPHASVPGGEVVVAFTMAHSTTRTPIGWHPENDFLSSKVSDFEK